MLNQLKVSIFDQLIGEHTLCLDPCQRVPTDNSPLLEQFLKLLHFLLTELYNNTRLSLLVINAL